jgi:RNA polymerase sigma-70 factor (ECF subfamily)
VDIFVIRSPWLVIGAHAEAKLARTSCPSRSDDEIGSWIADTVQRALAYTVTLIRNRAEAEDIVHDCYSRLLARSDRYDLPVVGTRLLYKAITNACINHTQRRPPVVSLDAADGGLGPEDRSLADTTDAGPEQRAIQGELEMAVAVALAELPLIQRAIVELQTLGHGSAEVADMLQISRANARVLLHRARQTLATRLRPFLEDQLT